MASNLDTGVGQHATVTNPTGMAGSVTQNPAAPVEAGLNSAKSAYTTTTSSAPLPPTGPAQGTLATVTIAGTVSTKSDGTETGSSVTGGYGNGATITYTVASNVASGGTVVLAGVNYMVGDVLTVVGDPGVTFTVATIS